MKKILFFVILLITLCFCVDGICGKIPINEIPMYGNVPPTQEEQKIHDRFIEETIAENGSREVAIKKGLEFAWHYYHTKDLKTAMKRFNQVWLLDHNNAEVYFGFGLLLKEQGQISEAIKMYDKALELNPNMPEVYNNRGNIYRGTGQLEQALADFTKAIELKPDFFLAYANRGVLYFYNRDYEKALIDLNRAIEINPKDAQSYNDRACVYLFMKEYEKAWDDVHKAESLGYKVNPRFLDDLRKASGREK